MRKKMQISLEFPFKYANFATLVPPSLFTMLKSGDVLFYDMAISFHKQYKSPSEIVSLLQSRGLIVMDVASATRTLTHIGYYRFSAYLYPFLSTPKDGQFFKPQSKFETALSLYQFDQELRSMVFDAIAEIEVAIRSALANIASQETGNVFWMTDVSTYRNQDKFLKTRAIIDKELIGSQEEFIKHFRQTYNDPYPPAWMLVEILPMGVLNHIYSNLTDNGLRKKIAAHFSLTAPVFSSWLTTIILTRNACCHHARVWNKENAIPPIQPRRIKSPWITTASTVKRFYFNLCIIKYFLDQIDVKNDFAHRLETLLSSFLMVDTKAMGFPSQWKNEPLWQD